MINHHLKKDDSLDSSHTACSLLLHIVSSLGEKALFLYKGANTKKLIFVYICQVRFLAISLRERSAGLFFLQWNRACCLFACLFCPTHSRLHLIFISRRYHAQLSWHSYCVTHETDFATQKLSFYCSLRGYISKLYVKM